MEKLPINSETELIDLIKNNYKNSGKIMLESAEINTDVNFNKIFHSLLENNIKNLKNNNINNQNIDIPIKEKINKIAEESITTDVTNNNEVDEYTAETIDINNILYLEDITFNKEVILEKCNFYDTISFKKISFKKEVTIKNNNIFNKYTLYDIYFSDNLILQFSNFYNETNFEKIYFQKNINIENCSFNYINTIFYNIDFSYESKFYFSLINSYEQSNIIIYFNRDNKNNKNNKLYIKKISKTINLVIKNLRIHNIDLSENEDIDNIIFNDCDFDTCNNLLTATFLKNMEIKRSNLIKALEYEHKEIQLYRKALENKKEKNFIDWSNLISIWLSKIYSNNCQNWILSIIMTVISTIIIFTIFYFPHKLNEIKNCFNMDFLNNYIYYLVKYIIPTDYEYILKYVKIDNIYILKKILSIFIYFFGKILFWYGTVQTIQSFRKFTKVS